MYIYTIQTTGNIAYKYMCFGYYRGHTNNFEAQQTTHMHFNKDNEDSWRVGLLASVPYFRFSPKFWSRISKLRPDVTALASTYQNLNCPPFLSVFIPEGLLGLDHMNLPWLALMIGCFQEPVRQMNQEQSPNGYSHVLFLVQHYQLVCISRCRNFINAY